MPKLISTIFAVIMLTKGYSQAVKSLTAIRNVNLIPMTSETLIPNQTVLVQDGIIKIIGDSQQVSIPSEAIILDGKGKYLMPGLADMHTHYLADYDRDAFLNLFLKNGVTSIRLFQSFPNDSVLVWQDEIKTGKLQGPSLFTCGFVFNGPEPSPDVIHNAKRNYDFIKIYSDLSAKEFTRLMQTAKQEKVYTIGHIPFLVGLDKFIAEGMNEIAHISEMDYELISYPKRTRLRPMFGYVIEEWYKEYYASGLSPEQYVNSKMPAMEAIVSKVKAAGLMVNSTLIVDKLIEEQLFHKEQFLQRPELPFMIPGFMPEYLAGENAYQSQVDLLANKHKKLSKGDASQHFIEMFYQINLTFLRKLHDAGVTILLGTDTPAVTVAVVPGYSVHEELQIMVDCGFSPYEALKTSTFNAGQTVLAMTGKNTIGTIEIGKQADMILTSANPLESISHLQTIQGIMLQGKWLSREQIDGLKVIIKASLADALTQAIRKEPGVQTIRNLYQDIKADSLEYYDIKESPINDLGYTLANLKRYEESIAVFTINTLEFPLSWNAWDSLAEAYMRSGNKKQAIVHYQKSLELNPQSHSGLANLKKLRR